jgi:hypothetical protein
MPAIEIAAALNSALDNMGTAAWRQWYASLGLAGFALLPTPLLRWQSEMSIAGE